MAAKTINIKCEHCGSGFDKLLSEYKRTKQHFCSNECLTEGRKGNSGTVSKRKQIECSNCYKAIWAAPWKLKRSKNHYCSKDCQQEHKIKEGLLRGKNNPRWKGGDIVVICAQCDKRFEINQSKYNGSLKRNPDCNFFCSDECNNTWRSINNRGENAYNWRGGKTPVIKSVRGGSRYDEWRLLVFERDDYTCQRCEQRGGDLEAHHQITLAEIIHEYEIDTIEEALECEAIWNINNGETLCKDCHKKEHRKLKVA